MTLPRIAIDAMGGDEGVRVMIDGAAEARRRHDRFKFLLVGDQAVTSLWNIANVSAKRARAASSATLGS